MQTHLYNIIETIDPNYDTYIFGPFIGELGWELFRWSGYVKWFKHKHKNAKNIVSTRKSRKDIYHGYCDEMLLFDIDGDYSIFTPNMYRLDNDTLDNDTYVLKRLQDDLAQYDAKIIHPPYGSHDKHIYDNHNLMEFKTIEHTKEYIESLIEPKRIPIMISPRHRTDLKTNNPRNWNVEYWEEFFNKLSNYDKLQIIIAGDKESTYIPLNKNDYIILHEHCISGIHSNIGITIEAIKLCKCVIGQQSAIPILSNYLKTPTIMWGDQKYRHSVVENPYNTRCIFLDEYGYNLQPSTLFYFLKEMINVT
jgi:hypothetical protein